MNIQYLIAYLLLVGLIGTVALYWYASARRRSAKMRALKLARGRQKASRAWQRLKRSSAGAP